MERLQGNNEQLQQRLTAAEDAISHVAKDEDSAQVIKSLEARLQEQDELISTQEGQLELDRDQKSRMKHELDRLKDAADRVILLEEDIKELEQQNLELTKKANTVDRFKQKLEAQRDLELEVQQLEIQNEDLRLRTKDFELLKHRNASLEATHSQFQDNLGKREMEIFELSSLKKTLEEEKAELQRKLARMEDMRIADENHIADLQEQLNSKQVSITSPNGTSLGNLEDELAQISNTDTRTNLEVSRLRAEIQLLKSNSASAQDAATLRIQLEEAERIRKREETKYNELFEKHVIATQQVTAILDASTAEGLVKGVNAAMLTGQLQMLTPEYYSTEAFSNLRKSYLSSTEKLSAAERKIQELEAELETAKRDLLVATNDRKSSLPQLLND
jgi:protein HOOK3